jgi:hypothetical protein
MPHAVHRHGENFKQVDKHSEFCDFSHDHEPDEKCSDTVAKPRIERSFKG